MKRLIESIREWFSDWKTDMEHRQRMNNRKAARWQLLNICPTLHDIEVDHATAAAILGITTTELDGIIARGDLPVANVGRATIGLIDVLSTDIVYLNRKEVMR